MTTQIYLISSGEYSDYAVHCAFTTLELALAYCARRNGITVEEQKRVHEVQALGYPEHHKALSQLSAKLRRVVNDADAFVERRDLFESLPLVPCARS